ncbi:MAG: acetyl-CoA carboxylase biotin carboxyl carrier protein [Defluviitaleaceae bacterium]|nr:acetyl-CoA carboxylase biotin carboxyl carrier protein [Defluviitaleaceae bacterium]
MDMKDIQALIETLDHSSISKLEWVKGDQIITLEKEKKELPVVVAPTVSPVTGVISAGDVPLAPVETPVPVDASQNVVKAQALEATTQVLAPLVGVFYQASSPEAQPFVEVGQRISEGETLCILEAMKVLNEIKAPKSGVIVAIHVNNGDVVEFDQVLMEIGD